MEIWITAISIILAFPIILFISIKINKWMNAEEEEEKKETEDNTISNMINDISLDEIKYIVEKETVDKINDLINKLISDAADTYRVMSVDSDTESITEKEANEISAYIKYKVSHNMTPTILASISLLYDISTPEKISELLDEKIKIYMIGMIVNRNKVNS